MLPILSCTFRGFGYRTEETSSCPVWDSGAAKGSQAHQLNGLLQFVLSHGGESWQVPCRASGGCPRSLCRGDPRGAPTPPPDFAPRCTAPALALVIVTLLTSISSTSPPPPILILKHTSPDGQVSCQPSFHTGLIKLFFRQSLQTLGDEEGESRGWDGWSFNAGWGNAVWGLGRAPRDAPRLCQHLSFSCFVERRETAEEMFAGK